jgi:hypothetical protein
MGGRRVFLYFGMIIAEQGLILKKLFWVIGGVGQKKSLDIQSVSKYTRREVRLQRKRLFVEDVMLCAFIRNGRVKCRPIVT